MSFNSWGGYGSSGHKSHRQPLVKSSSDYGLAPSAKKPKQYTSDELESERADAIKAARELAYGNETVTKLKNAKTVYEMSRILATARERLYNA